MSPLQSESKTVRRDVEDTGVLWNMVLFIPLSSLFPHLCNLSRALTQLTKYKYNT